MRFSTAVLVASTFAFATAKPAYDLKRLVARATLPVPASQGSVTFSKAEPITDFDGGMQTFGRGVECTGQKEGGSADAVFIIKDGGSLSNAIIGADQIEGVHCEGACTITNVPVHDDREPAAESKTNVFFIIAEARSFKRQLNLKIGNKNNMVNSLYEITGNGQVLFAGLMQLEKEMW